MYENSVHENKQVQLTAAIPMSPMEKRSVETRAKRLLIRDRRAFKSALMHVYVKSANGKIGVSANLFTDNGRYHAYAESWNVRVAVDEALHAVHEQVLKRIDRLEHFRTIAHA